MDQLCLQAVEAYVQADLPVEAAGAQESGVEDVRPVGGGDQDHALVGLEPVHLDKQLVQRLFALIIAAAIADTARAADRVEDRRRVDGQRARTLAPQSLLEECDCDGCDFPKWAASGLRRLCGWLYRNYQRGIC